MKRPINMTAAEYSALPKQRRHKYGAKKTTVDGIKFHSKGEAMRWMALKMLERAGKITRLARQHALHLRAAGHDGILGKYVADFSYRTDRGTVYEDFKGFDTPLSIWKRKHAEAEYGIKILITGRKRSKRARVARAA